MSVVKGNSCCQVVDYNNMEKENIMPKQTEIDKTKIGDKIMSILEKYYPSKPKLSAKITGMILQQDNAKLLKILECIDSLDETILDCVQVLAEAFIEKEKEDETSVECAICMDKLDKNKNYAKTACQHSFCLTCLTKCLKLNNTCPLCRANIEDENPPNTKALNLQDGVDLIKEEIIMINLREHVELITMFDNPVLNLKNTLRIFGLGLVKRVIEFQNDEEYLESSDDE